MACVCMLCNKDVKSQDKVSKDHVCKDAITNISEESAESEPAWKKAGKEVGVQIWRIVVR